MDFSFFLSPFSFFIMAGLIKFLVPIDHASGKTFGLSERFISTYREETDHRGCAYRWKSRNMTSNPLSGDEMAARTAFTACSKKVKAIFGTQVTYDKWVAAYKAAKKAGSVEQKTLRGYVFAQVMDGNVNASNEPTA